jgi:hypothetical protein
MGQGFNKDHREIRNGKGDYQSPISLSPKESGNGHFLEQILESDRDQRPARGQSI